MHTPLHLTTTTSITLYSWSQIPKLLNLWNLNSFQKNPSRLTPIIHTHTCTQSCSYWLSFLFSQVYISTSLSSSPPALYVKSLFQIFGLPKFIYSDRWPEFSSKKMSSFLVHGVSTRQKFRAKMWPKKLFIQVYLSIGMNAVFCTHTSNVFSEKISIFPTTLSTCCGSFLVLKQYTFISDWQCTEPNIVIGIREWLIFDVKVIRSVVFWSLTHTSLCKLKSTLVAPVCPLVSEGKFWRPHKKHLLVVNRQGNVTLSVCLFTFLLAELRIWYNVTDINFEQAHRHPSVHQCFYQRLCLRSHDSIQSTCLHI